MVKFNTAPYDDDNIDVPYEELEQEPYKTLWPRWSGTLCDCFANIYPTMVCSFFCTSAYASYLYGLQTSMVNMHKSIAVILTLMCSSYAASKYGVPGANALMLSSQVFLFCLANQVRKTVRNANSIAGSDCEDAVVTVACLPCSLAQTARTMTEPKAIFE
jgi:Cys-rich protein (TIGR01571 family)